MCACSVYFLSFSITMISNCLKFQSSTLNFSISTCGVKPDIRDPYYWCLSHYLKYWHLFRMVGSLYHINWTLTRQLFISCILSWFNTFFSVAIFRVGKAFCIGGWGSFSPLSSCCFLEWAQLFELLTDFSRRSDLSDWGLKDKLISLCAVSFLFLLWEPAGARMHTFFSEPPCSKF